MLSAFGADLEKSCEYFRGLVLGGERALVLTLRFVADESHDEQGQRVMTMAGLLAPMDWWSCLILEWSRVLSEESANTTHADDCERTERRVEVFHAVDCEHGEGDFAGWCRPRIESLQRRLIGLVTDRSYGLIGYATSIPIAHHAKFRATLRRLLMLHGGSINGPLDDPWFYTLQTTLQAVAGDPRGYPRDEPIQCIFDQNELSERGKVIYRIIRDLPANRVRLSGGIAFGDKAKLVPLQAADLYAYETFRYQDGTRRGLPERWQYAALRPIVQIDAFLGEDHLSKAIPAAEQRVAELRARGELRSSISQKRRPRRPAPKVGPVEFVRRLTIRVIRWTRRLGRGRT